MNLGQLALRCAALAGYGPEVRWAELLGTGEEGSAGRSGCGSVGSGPLPKATSQREGREKHDCRKGSRAARALRPWRSILL